MEVTLIAIGTKMPKWIEEGYEEYARRLGRDCKLTLKEIPAPRRSNSEDSASVVKKEGELLLASVPKDACAIALDERGKLQSTQSIADKLRQLRGTSQSLALLVVPHAMVRVIVAEQIYRSVSLLNNHPYHRV